MKKLVMCLLSVALFASCTKPEILEGQITQMETLMNPAPKLTSVHPTHRAKIALENDSWTVDVSSEVAMKFIKSVNAGEKQLYVRLIKDKDDVYNLKEIAVMDYDQGTPPLFVFPSDGKVIATYKMN